jgi:hypothetical protein
MRAHCAVRESQLKRRWGQPNKGVFSAEISDFQGQKVALALLDFLKGFLREIHRRKFSIRQIMFSQREAKWNYSK